MLSLLLPSLKEGERGGEGAEERILQYSPGRVGSWVYGGLVVAVGKQKQKKSTQTGREMAWGRGSSGGSSSSSSSSSSTTTQSTTIREPWHLFHIQCRHLHFPLLANCHLKTSTSYLQISANPLPPPIPFWFLLPLHLHPHLNKSLLDHFLCRTML